MSDKYVEANGAIIIGPYVVDADKCAHTTQGPHECIHDWRIYWGNVPRTEEE